jgi:NADP-dependent 3-hydroxy acid dehydrogenase YdfG
MHFIEMDVTKEEDWEMFIENTIGLWGRLDILVNNAGTSYKNKVGVPEFLDDRVGPSILMLPCSRA